MLNAATSCARAAISGVENVPSQIRLFFLGSRISETHFPHARIRTPLYTGCLLSSLGLFFCFLAEYGFGFGSDISGWRVGRFIRDDDPDEDGEEGDSELFESVTELVRSVIM